MCRDISVLCSNPAPLKKWDLSLGNALGPEFLQQHELELFSLEHIEGVQREDCISA